MSRNIKNTSGTDTGNVNNGRITVMSNLNNYKYLDDGIINDVTVAELLDSYDLYVQATGSGTSPSLSLNNDGDYILSVESTGAFALDVQQKGEDDFSDMYYDSTTKVTIDSTTGPQSVRVPGGYDYRMDIDTYNSIISMYAKRVNE